MFSTVQEFSLFLLIGQSFQRYVKSHTVVVGKWQLLREVVGYVLDDRSIQTETFEFITVENIFLRVDTKFIWRHTSRLLTILFR